MMVMRKICLIAPMMEAKVVREVAVAILLPTELPTTPPT